MHTGLPPDVPREIERQLAKAQADFSLVPPGETRGIVAVSGGKDSLALLHVLTTSPRFRHVEWLPVHVDAGFAGDAAAADAFRAHLAGYGEYLWEKTDIAEQVRAETHFRPCWRCSRLRRKRLVEIADERGIRLIALGHQRDDFTITFLMNILSIGETSGLLPAQPIFGGRFALIRPLVYVPEAAVRAFVAARGWPVFKNSCGFDNGTRRSQMKRWLSDLEREHPEAGARAFRALFNLKAEFMPVRPKRGPRQGAALTNSPYIQP